MERVLRLKSRICPDAMDLERKRHCGSMGEVMIIVRPSYSLSVLAVVALQVRCRELREQQTREGTNSVKTFF